MVFDDMDVPNGTVRLRAKGGHGGHNGMRSITQHFSGSKEFPRLRLGMWPAFGQRIALDWSRWKAALPVISQERQSDRDDDTRDQIVCNCTNDLKAWRLQDLTARAETWWDELIWHQINRVHSPSMCCPLVASS